MLKYILVIVVSLGFITPAFAGNGVMELVGFKDFTLFKFCEGESDDWNQKMQGNGTVTFECNDKNGGCFVMVDAIDICGNQDIRYNCDDDTVITLLSSGVLLVPDTCEGTCGVCPS